MLPAEQISQIKDELLTSKRPIFFFHDDPDGLCSFLLLYRFIKRGRGIIVKSTPCVTKSIYAKKVLDYDADKIFVLDLAVVEQDFIDEVKKPVVWLDHHDILKRENVTYFNTRQYGPPIPPTAVCYDIVKQDMWIAACGCIGDWYIPHFINEFRQDYPNLIGEDLKKPGDILYKSRLGKLVAILATNLKGKTKEVMASLKILTRITAPEDILEQKTPQGKFLFKRFEKINMLYEKLRDEALNHINGKVVLFVYSEKGYSFTSGLSNEISYLHPDKIVVICRKKGDEFKLSLRRGDNNTIDLRKVLEIALRGIDGFGGGHEFACGGSVKEKDFSRFIENLKAEVKDVV